MPRAMVQGVTGTKPVAKSTPKRVLFSPPGGDLDCSGGNRVHVPARPVTSSREESDSLWKICGQDDELAEQVSSAVENEYWPGLDRSPSPPDPYPVKDPFESLTRCSRMSEQGSRQIMIGFAKHARLLSALVLVIGALSGCERSVLDPAGPVCEGDRIILLDSLAIMLAIVIPSIVAILAFAYWFRASNTRAQYLPNWAYSGRLELIVWSISALVVFFLGIEDDERGN